MERIFFALGSILAGLAVVAGAYGAHGATSTLGAEQVIWINKAARYQMYHALALLVISFAMVTWQEKAKLFQVAGWLLLAGIMLFSGSLYAMAFFGGNLGYMTPAGGFAFIGGWMVMAFAGLLNKKGKMKGK